MASSGVVCVMTSGQVDDEGQVRQLRLVVNASDLDAAVAFYRDALGMPETGRFEDQEGRVLILDAGRATVELTDAPHAAYVDRVEGVTGEPVPTLRVAFEVEDAGGVTRRLEAAGARVVAEPTTTPWRSSNARLDGPDGVAVTVFQELGQQS